MLQSISRTQQKLPHHIVNIVRRFCFYFTEKVFSFLSKDEVENLKQEEERKIATLRKDKKHKKLIRNGDDEENDNENDADENDEANDNDNGDDDDCENDIDGLKKVR